MSRDHEYFKRNPETWVLNQIVQKRKEAHAKTNSHPLTESKYGTVVNGGTVKNINSGVKLMTRRDQDESDDDFMPISQQKRKKSIITKEATIEPKDPTSSNFSRSRSKNTSPSSNSQYSEIAGSNRGTQIITTKGSSATVFSDSKSQCLDKSPIEKADEQISSADETNMTI
ncbi:unnamed protein product [Rhizophagus irregularis]|uniref:Uncharacterized protein n=1 Tax=Rhizophagus irregularis TaxID=588596 RepID=A0A915ZS91_9GLOM|nr:unnamed protein product [Rhizophagus irregularis]